MRKLCIRTSFLFTMFFKIVIGQWSSWATCGSIPGCFQRRVLLCTIGDTLTEGVQCASISSGIFEQITQTGCDIECITNDAWVSTRTAQTCRGNCYDANMVIQATCATNSACRLRSSFRCYDENSCVDSWSRTKAQTECTSFCGGGTLIWTTACRNALGDPSYNCNGTDGDINAVSSEVVQCNTNPCIASWGNWAAVGQCSKSCDGGLQAFMSTCTYNQTTTEATICSGSNGLTTRSRMTECNTVLCDDLFGQWTLWTSCRNCSGVRSRERLCDTCSEGDLDFVTESCESTPECSNSPVNNHPTTTFTDCDVSGCGKASFLTEPYFIPMVASIGGVLVILVVFGLICLVKKRKKKLSPTSNVQFDTFQNRNSFGSLQSSEPHSGRNSGRASTMDSTTPFAKATTKKIKDEKSINPDLTYLSNGKVNLSFEPTDQYAKIEDIHTNQDNKTSSLSGQNNNTQYPIDDPYEEISTTKIKRPSVTTGESAWAPSKSGVKPGVGYTSMHDMIDPAYTSLRPDQISRQGSVASHLTRPSDSEDESWESSTGSGSDFPPEDDVSHSNHAVSNMYATTMSPTREKKSNGERDIPNSTGRRNVLMYSTIDPHNKTTKKISVHKKSRKSRKSSRRTEFTRGTSTRLSSNKGLSKVRSSSRALAYPSIPEDKMDLPPSHEPYEVMKSNVMIESPYENNENKKSTTTASPSNISSEKRSTAKSSGDIDQRSPMPIPRILTKKLKMAAESDSPYAEVQADEDEVDNYPSASGQNY